MEQFADPALLIWLLLLLLLEDLLLMLLPRQTHSWQGRYLGQSPYSRGDHAASHQAGHVGNAVVDVLHGAIDAQHVGEIILIDAQHPLQCGHGILGTMRSFGQFPPPSPGPSPSHTVSPIDIGLAPATTIPHVIPHHRLSVPSLQSPGLSQLIISEIRANTPIIPAISTRCSSS